ncbi:MAG TPA: hypothetical protein VG406_26960 [Isosphaeraceae bacterium]|nr:hypothetical protein [Isosphaeraceae bacterium]
MDRTLRRRRFLQAASAMGLGAGLGAVATRITPARAAEMVVTPEAVRLRPEIEPVVRWIEEVPRDRAFDAAVDHLARGLSYRDLLAGLFLAGIRNIKPRPVGFKFHAVMVMNSAHLLGQTAAVEDRLLPMFWALDNFKRSQEQDVKEGDWTLAVVDEPRVPGAGRAREEFVRAMDRWDADAADAAVAGLCRSAGAAEVMEPFWRMGLRDHRNIGHKPIFTMQCWRTLQAIGWQHAEPVLRSLAFGQLDLQGDKDPAPAGPYEANLANVRKVRDGWQVGRTDPAATTAVLDAIRHADAEGASAAVVAQLNRGVAPESLWDAVALGAGEVMMRKPGILAIHAVTASNALHFTYGAAADPTTRLLALLQAAGWLPLMRDRNTAADGPAIDSIEPVSPDATGDEAVGEVFSALDSDRRKAAAKAIGYLGKGGSPDLIFDAARRLIFRKGRDAHDYKFGAAIWEEFRLAADPRWQGPLTAAALFNFPGSGSPDSPLMRQAVEAVARLKA